MAKGRKIDFAKAATRAVIVAGSAAGASIAAAKIAPGISPMIKGAGLIAVGAFVPSMSKNEMIGQIGDGLAAAGGIMLATKFFGGAPSVEGIGDGAYVIDQDYKVSGDEEYESLSGTEDDDTLSGIGDSEHESIMI